MASASSDPYALVDDGDDDYIKVSAGDSEEFMEIPMEDDGTVMLSTIQTQFPDAIGLKCKGLSGAWRAIRAVENRLAAPKGGWGDRIYCVTLSETRKRKSDVTSDDTRESKISRPLSDPLLRDIAVRGLPFKTNTAELRQYFEQNYGETAYCEVIYDVRTKESRGFGFVRFKDMDTARQAVDAEHYINGRKVVLNLKQEKPMKMFVGRLPHGATKEEIEEYFSQYGKLTDVFIPTPFRNFAFITYASKEDGYRVLQESHELRDSRLNVEERKQDQRSAGNENKKDIDNRSRSSSGGYTTRDYRQAKNAPQKQNNMAGDIKDMLLEFLAKSS